MFSHLFNTYESVTSPIKYKYNPKNLTIQVSEADPITIDLIRLEPTFKIPNTDKPSNLPIVTQQLESATEEPEQNPFLINLDIKSPLITTTGKFNNVTDFIKSLNTGYRKALLSRGLDPNYSYILTALAAMESGWGVHLAGKFNFGGIKITDKEAIAHPERVNRVMTTDWSQDRGYFRHYLNFRNFESIDDYCNYRIDLLSNKRYNVFNTVNSNKPYDFVFHILSKGYGSDYGGPESKKYATSVVKNYNTIMNILNI